MGSHRSRYHFPEWVRWESDFCRSEPVDTGSMRCAEITPEMAGLLAALRCPDEILSRFSRSL